MTNAFISYVRVSTDQQGKSGLGLAAQEQAIDDYVERRSGTLVASYKEIESGRKRYRPQLEKALADCRQEGATLVVAKIDRLMRNAAFLGMLIEGDVPIVFCDLPTVDGPIGKYMLTSMAAVAELESALISQRTRSALAAARARGIKLGCPVPHVAHAASLAVRQRQADEFADKVGWMLSSMRQSGQSLQKIADTLNKRRIATARGGKWHACTVSNVLARAASSPL